MFDRAHFWARSSHGHHLPENEQTGPVPVPLHQERAVVVGHQNRTLVVELQDPRPPRGPARPDLMAPGQGRLTPDYTRGWDDQCGGCAHQEPRRRRSRRGTQPPAWERWRRVLPVSRANDIATDPNPAAHHRDDHHRPRRARDRPHHACQSASGRTVGRSGAVSCLAGGDLGVAAKDAKLVSLGIGEHDPSGPVGVASIGDGARPQLDQPGQLSVARAFHRA